MSYGYTNNNNHSYPPGPPGEAASYYQQQPQGQYPPQQQQQYPPQGQQFGGPGQQFPPGQHGQMGLHQAPLDGERGVLGAIGGGVAGGFGGHAVGNAAGGHNKLGTVFGVVAGAIAGHKLQDGVEDWKDGRDEKKEEEKRKEEERKRDEERKAEERKRDEERKREEEKRRHEQPQQSSSGVKYAGGFSGSVRDIRLDSGGEYMLRASCRRMDGSYQDSSISLNKILENDQGSFRWASQGSKRQPSPQRGCATRQVTVQPGDTLRAIATQVGCTFDELARANGIQNPDLIYPGQILNVPGGAHGGHQGHGNGHEQRGGDTGNFGASARNVRLVDGGKRLEGELLRNGQWVGSSVVLDERIGNDNGTLTYKC
ncbi:CVNH domain-containing protein [Podospora conica]|nr:CVNH domain-containing protein [Schizothecium conicum]